MSIDLSLLPAPAVVEALDYETILASIKADLLAIRPETADVLALESEPLVKLLEVAAYRELLLRARINAAARGVMLAYAEGSDLDHLAALFGVARIEGEDDARLRARAQLSIEGLSTAGPRLSYVFHALSASNAVRDVSVSSPSPGDVLVVVLAEPGEATPNGLPDAALLQTVLDRVNADDVRPLTDFVSVVAAELLTYTVRADLIVGSGPDSDVVLAAARAALDEYTEQQFALGRDIAISGLHAALHQSGVTRVDLISPAATLTVAQNQAARCLGADIRIAGVDQ